jgi:hypothetical protein
MSSNTQDPNNEIPLRQVQPQANQTNNRNTLAQASSANSESADSGSARNSTKKHNRKSRGLVGSLLNTIANLSLVIVILLAVIAVIIGVGSGIWLQTYKAFTQEKLIATVEAEELKTDADDYPYFKITYTPVDNPSALTKLLVRDSEGSSEKEVENSEEYYIHGDRFVIEAEVINFGNLSNLLGFKTIYKVTRIKGDYSDTQTAQNGRKSIYDVNGGIDPVWETLEYNQEILQPFVDGVYGSAVTQGARRQESKWEIYMTEDGLIMKNAD